MEIAFNFALAWACQVCPPRGHCTLAHGVEQKRIGFLVLLPRCFVKCTPMILYKFTFPCWLCVFLLFVFVCLVVPFRWCPGFFFFFARRAVLAIGVLLLRFYVYVLCRYPMFMSVRFLFVQQICAIFPRCFSKFSLNLVLVFVEGVWQKCIALPVAFSQFCYMVQIRLEFGGCHSIVS